MWSSFFIQFKAARFCATFKLKLMKMKIHPSIWILQHNEEFVVFFYMKLKLILNEHQVRWISVIGLCAEGAMRSIQYQFVVHSE